MTIREAVRHKAWLNLAPRMATGTGIIGRLRDALKNVVPVGYQDESGFHFGVKSAEK